MSGKVSAGKKVLNILHCWRVTCLRRELKKLMKDEWTVGDIQQVCKQLCIIRYFHWKFLSLQPEQVHTPNLSADCSV